jgi:hypothetical protein
MYIDAGSGSMLFQALAALLISGVVFYRQILNSLKNLFIRKKENDD